MFFFGLLKRVFLVQRNSWQLQLKLENAMSVQIFESVYVYNFLIIIINIISFILFVDWMLVQFFVMIVICCYVAHNAKQVACTIQPTSRSRLRKLKELCFS